MRKKLYILVVAFICLSIMSYGQDEAGGPATELEFGVGVPEFAGISIGMASSPVVIRFGAGTIPIPDDFLWSVYGDLGYHFAGTPRYGSLPPWYARLGLVYTEEIKSTWKDKYLYTTLRLGRRFVLDAHWCIGMDAGLGYELYYERIKLTPDAGDSFLDFKAVPAFGVHGIYSF